MELLQAYVRAAPPQPEDLGTIDEPRIRGPWMTAMTAMTVEVVRFSTPFEEEMEGVAMIAAG